MASSIYRSNSGAVEPRRRVKFRNTRLSSVLLLFPMTLDITAISVLLPVLPIGVLVAHMGVRVERSVFERPVFVLLIMLSVSWLLGNDSSLRSSSLPTLPRSCTQSEVSQVIAKSSHSKGRGANS